MGRMQKERREATLSVEMPMVECQYLERYILKDIRESSSAGPRMKKKAEDWTGDGLGGVGW